jgi:hypothetical protein
VSHLSFVGCEARKTTHDVNAFAILAYQLPRKPVGMYDDLQPQAMYLRFVVAEIHEATGRELGVFQAVANLRHDGELYAHEEEQHDLIRRWFNNNLEKPTRFTPSKAPFYRKKSKAISWFKDTAHEHLARIRSLVAILENHGVAVRMLRTERVGYVVYEDEYQIVAEPFAGEPL